jgi:hypothetical protein
MSQDHIVDVSGVVVLTAPVGIALLIIFWIWLLVLIENGFVVLIVRLSVNLKLRINYEIFPLLVTLLTREFGVSLM